MRKKLSDVTVLTILEWLKKDTSINFNVELDDCRLVFTRKPIYGGPVTPYGSCQIGWIADPGPFAVQEGYSTITYMYDVAADKVAKPPTPLTYTVGAHHNRTDDILAAVDDIHKLLMDGQIIDTPVSTELSNQILKSVLGRFLPELVEPAQLDWVVKANITIRSTYGADELHKKVCALFKHGTIRDAFDAADLELVDFNLIKIV